MTVLQELIELRRKVPPIPQGPVRASLAQRFLVPPFSVLDARQGYWLKRKREWLALGMRGRVGRSVNVGNYSASVAGITDPEEVARWNETRRSNHKNKSTTSLCSVSSGARSHYSDKKVNSFNTGGLVMDGKEVMQPDTGISTFDPVLCELVYRWFCPLGGKILDPFTGGCVSGIVAAELGRSFVGIDLRQEQVDANYEQLERICPDGDVVWHVGDSADIEDITSEKFDLLFSCPPYADLEVYSDDPRDVSTMSYPDFLSAYGAIITRCCYLLKPDRFACFLVGNVRDKVTGNYHDLVGDTVHAFKLAGLSLYNEAVLVTSVGSLPIRVGAQFGGSRKLGKAHQNLLVFLKGDAALAARSCGEIDLDDLQMPSLEKNRLAVCFKDVEGLPCCSFLDGSSGDLSDCAVIQLPRIEAALLCDVLRGEARSAGRPVPRIWVGTNEGWNRVEELQTLTYLVGDKAFLSRDVFPDAPRPVQDRPPVQKMR